MASSMCKILRAVTVARTASTSPLQLCSRSIAISPVLMRKQRIRRIEELEAQAKAGTKKNQKTKESDSQKTKITILDPDMAKLKAEKALTPEQQEFMLKRPEDDIWETHNYPPKYFTLKEVLELYQDINRPSQYNNGNGIVMMNLLISMHTKKRTKFEREYEGIIEYPHVFSTGASRMKIVAFSENDEDIEIAKKMGAVLSGGSLLVQQIATDDHDLYHMGVDFVLSTIQMLPELVPIKDRLPIFPNKADMTTGLTIERMMEIYTRGIQYRTERHELEDLTLSRLKVPIGTLNMETQQLEENFKHLQDVVQDKSTVDDRVVMNAQCSVPPSPEQLYVRLAWQDGWGATNETSSDINTDTEAQAENDEVTAQGQ